MILQIEREWSKEPGWFAGLSHEHKVVVLAERRLRLQLMREARKGAT